MSIDGTDCKIREPIPFNRKWYSHKFSSAGLRYEIGISIEQGHIVWVYGPFPCGDWPDVKIFRHRLKGLLHYGEQVVSDKGYPDQCCVSNSTSNQILFSRIRARHETVNRRFKEFRVIGSVFRNDLSLHGKCFHAVTNIVQLMLENGYPLFSL